MWAAVGFSYMAIPLGDQGNVGPYACSGKLGRSTVHDSTEPHIQSNVSRLLVTYMQVVYRSLIMLAMTVTESKEVHTVPVYDHIQNNGSSARCLAKDCCTLCAACSILGSA